MEGRLEAFFLGRVKHAPFPNHERYSWGALYAFTGNYLNRSLILYFFSFLAFVVFIGYAVSAAKTPFSYFKWFEGYPFLLPCMTGLFLPLPVFSSLPLPSGRRDRFRQGITVGVLVGLVLSAAALGVAALSIGVEPFMPELELGGRRFTFLAPGLHNGCLPLLFSPFLFTFQLYVPRNNSFLLILPLLALVWSLPLWHGLITRAGPGWVALSILAGWALFAGLLYRVCTGKDLVKR